MPLFSSHTITNGNIVNSKVVNVAGDVILDGVKGDLSEMLLEMMQNEAAKLTSIALEDFKARLKGFADSFFRYLVEKGQLDLIESLKDFRIQFDLHDGAKGFVSTDDENQKRLILETLIARMQTINGTSVQKVSSEAVRLASEMPYSSACLLALLSLRTLFFSGMAFMLNEAFKAITTFVDHMPEIGDVDVEYLKMKNCLMPVSGIYGIQRLEDTLLHHYDLFFRHRLSEEVFAELSTSISNFRHPVGKFNTCMLYPDNSANTIQYGFIETNYSIFAKELDKNNLGFLKDTVNQVKQSMPAYTPEEVYAYMISLSPKWERVFELLNQEKMLHMHSSIVGSYIGTTLLCQKTGQPQMTLDQLTNPREV